MQIPDRDVFKASEVCELAHVQPYVLRSWEKEFPNLGVARSATSARIYRRADVERVLRIKQLVFDEGLTLAGARKRLDGVQVLAPVEDDLPAVVDDDTRTRLAEIKRGLRSLLDMLEEGRGPVPAEAGAEASQPTLLDASEGDAPWPPPGGPAKKRSAPRKRVARPDQEPPSEA
jgi:DNA-binding transcriptional MerR regulator